MDDLIRITLKFQSSIKKENEPLNPILFSGLLYYQLLTVVPYDVNDILYSSYAVTKYLQEVKILPKISVPLSKLIHDSKNECDDRMAEVRQACNINQWLLFYLDMLDKAFAKIPNHTNLIFHSDQGWQYQMEAYHIELNEKEIIQSMSRKGNCYDNSPMENFFGIMKREMFYGHEYEFQTLEELEIAMKEYIEYYNTQRITTILKGLTPIQYRNQSLA